MILSAKDEGLEIKRGLQGAVDEANGLHGTSTQLFVGKHHAVPGKHGVALQVQVVHHVTEGIHVMLSAAAHLVLPTLQEVQHRRVVVELRIDGQRLHRHTHGVQEPLVRTSIVYRGEERLPLVIVLGQQEAVGRREEIALEDALLLAEGIHLRHLDVQRTNHRGLRMLRYLQVGRQLRKRVAAVAKLLGIPLLTLLEGWCLAQFGLRPGNVCHRQFLGCQRLAVVGLLHVAEHHFQCRTVANDMVYVQEEVEVFGILHQTDMEQPVVVKVKRHYELFFLCFNIRYVFHLQFIRLTVLYRL